MQRGRFSNLVDLGMIACAVLSIKVAASSADQSPPHLGLIFGTVSNQVGAPLPGARIAIRCTKGSWNGVADANGQFASGPTLSGSCRVTVSAPGWAGATADVAVQNERNAVNLALASTVAKPAKDAVGNSDKTSRALAEKKPAGSVASVNASPARQVLAKSVARPAPPVARDADSVSDSSEYTRIDDNPYLSVASSPLSTFAADVDTASYAVTRGYLREGQLPPKDAVRVEELVNYFSYQDATPTGAEPFAVSSELSVSPWNPSYKLLRIGLRTQSIDSAQVPARNLVFLLDVSGSMQGSNRLPLVKQAMDLLIAQLRPQDRVAIAVYAGASGVALPSTTGDHKDTIRDAVARLQAGGSTNGAAGIQLAYELAQKSFIKGGINRVILATDGDFNVGVSSEGDLTRLIENKREQGVFLTVLGVGMGNHKDSRMEKLADRGNGNYGYIDSLEEARKLLVKEAGATLVTVAKDVKFQLEWNPAAVAGYRLIGYENRLLRDQDFNDDKKDAGDMGAGHTVTALYEVVPAGVAVPGAAANKVDALKYQTPGVVAATNQGYRTELATIKLRYKAPDANASKLISSVVFDMPATFASASTDLRWAASVASFGMLLRGSKFVGSVSWSEVATLARNAKGADIEGYRREFIELLGQAARLANPPSVAK
jgi:Ca-activated chloride channel homolog